MAKVKPPKVVENSENRCPKCGSKTDMDWGAFEIRDVWLGFYPFTCECGATGREWHRIEYIESEFDEPCDCPNCEEEVT